MVIAPVREVLLRDTARLSAEVSPWVAVTVATEATGRVVAVPAEVGDSVAVGDVLARLDAAATEARLARAEAQVAEAEATLAQGERDLARGRELAATEDISAGELDRLTLGRDTAAARLAAAQADVRLARDAVDDTVVRAPIAGVVSERHLEVGSWTDVGAPVARLVDRRRVKVRAAASQRDRARLEPGLPAEIELEALPGERFAGKVRLLGQEADPSTGTYLVEVAVTASEAGGRLLPGMQGALRIEIGSRTARVVPPSAWVETSGGGGLYTVRDGKARFQSPQIGSADAQHLEITSGLELGESVVVVGQHVLRDGDPVVAEARGEESGR